MDLGDITDRIPDRDDLRRELQHLTERMPSGHDVRSRMAELPASARRWVPGRHEPTWSDALTLRSLALFGVGMALGAGLAALLSPRSGPTLRRDLIHRVRRLREEGVGREGGHGGPPRGNGPGTDPRPDLSHH